MRASEAHDQGERRRDEGNAHSKEPDCLEGAVHRTWEHAEGRELLERSIERIVREQAPSSMTRNEAAPPIAQGRQRGDGSRPSGKTNAIAITPAKSKGQPDVSQTAATRPPGSEPGCSRA